MFSETSTCFVAVVILVDLFLNIYGKDFRT